MSSNRFPSFTTSPVHSGRSSPSVQPQHSRSASPPNPEKERPEHGVDRGKRRRTSSASARQLPPRQPFAASAGGRAHESPHLPAIYRTPTLRFDRNPVPPGRPIPAFLEASFRQIRKGLFWFPIDMRNIDVELHPASEEDKHASGFSSYGERVGDGGNETRPVKVRLYVNEAFFDPAFDPEDPKNADDIAHLEYSLVHELGDHAMDYCNSLVKDLLPLPEMVHHLKVFAPSDRENAFHQVVASAGSYVDAARRPLYFAHYVEDVRDLVTMDYEGRSDLSSDDVRFARQDDAVYDAGMAWHKQLSDHLPYMDNSIWLYAGRPPRPAPDSSGMEDDPRFPEGSNPMQKRRGEDLKEAIEYRAFIDNKRRENEEQALRWGD